MAPRTGDHLRTLIVATVILLAVPARAQDTPVVDVGVGYAFLHDKELDENFTTGWLASLSYNVSRSLALTGEVGGNRASFPSGDDVPVDLDLTFQTLMGGFRFMGRGNDSLHPYLQVLAGAVRSKVSVDGVDLGAADTNFAVQPGVGIDFRLRDNLSLRLGGDYRWIKGEGGADNGSEYRAHAGIAFGIGRRN
jgi:opacity protein-like surface antigen